MTVTKYFRNCGAPLAILVAFAAWFSVPLTTVQAQCSGAEGNNAIYANCGTHGALGIQGSTAYIDASVFASTSTDFCATIYGILNSGSYPAAGAVIDARGISSHNSNLTCASTTSPWYESSGGYLDKPSVLLLPAQTITIPYTWLLPNMTKIIGEGASNTALTGTVLAAASGFAGLGVANVPTAMIQFGDQKRTGSLTCGGTGVCFDISVEELTLNGTSQAIDGILNLDSEELTYVRDVSLYQITGTGLEIGNLNFPNQEQNSGPYTDIYYSSGSSSGNCVKIYGLTMRGIHGLDCVASSNTNGAILLDSAGNTLEDVYVDGFKDGVLIGSVAKGAYNGSGNVLLNISGSSAVTNLVHICNPNTNTGNCPGTTGTYTLNNVTDVSVVGVTAGGTNTIEDDMSVTTLPVSSDAHVGMYALGEAMGNGFSRFSTSKSFPTWYIGNFDISGSCSSAQTGSLYSNTGTSTTGLFVCAGSSWTGVN